MASLSFSSWSWYGSVGSSRISSVPLSVLTSIRGATQPCQGSERKSDPRSPIASSSSRSGRSRPESNWQRTPAKRIVPPRRLAELIIAELREAERNVEPDEIQELEALVWKRLPNP